MTEWNVAEIAQGRGASGIAAKCFCASAAPRPEFCMPTSIEIVRDTNISTLIGTEVYVGYGTSDTEMLAASRYRGVYKVQ